ncbi:MAG: hypothetical protein ABI405_05290 [Parafilimonas sp.]
MKLTIYRILSFLLLPVAIIFSISFLLFIRAAFSNPAMLFPLFLIACIAIYSFASLNFLIRGIDGKKHLGRSSKEWLKVNAVVSTIFALLMISQCIVFLMHPEMLQDLVAQAKQNAGADLKMSNTAMENYLRVTSYFFLVYAVVLFVHIIISFQYIKLYNYLFQNQKQQ